LSHIYALRCGGQKKQKKTKKLDYIHSPSHGCITQLPCVAPSGESARVIAYIALRWVCRIQQQNHSVNYANHHSPFARRRHDFRQAVARRFKLHSPPLLFGKSFMKIRSAVPENLVSPCLIFFDGRKKTTVKQAGRRHGSLAR